MKKIILSLVLSFALSAVVSAQDRVKTGDFRTRTAQVTRLMAQQMRLNESEYIRLKTLNEERLQKTEEVVVQYKFDVVMKDAKLKEIEENFDRQVLGMLSASQLTAYFDFKENPPVSYTALMKDEAGI